LKPADVRNRLTAVIFLRDFPNTKFDSQTKETLTNSISDVSKYVGNSIDFERFAKQILKNEAIINPIVDMFKLKEELKSRQELKQSKKAKVRSDKYMSPIGAKKYLFLCEGQSATSSLCSCIGRNGCGYYSLRGLPINTLDNSMQRIAANQEFKDVMNILELDVTKDQEHCQIAFDKIIIATDQDLDGIHLSSMLIGWFKRFAPNLFNEGKICKLQTPLILIKDNKENIKEYFFDLDSFKKWEKANPNSRLNIIYQKGLGSIERADINWLIEKNNGIEQFLYEFHQDDDAFKNIDLWLTGDSEPRKEKLRKYTLDINLA
jgi:DNA topoisomerase-2